MNRKDVVHGGGSVSRLNQTTLAMIKWLLSVYEKPMVYFYPLATFLLDGIHEILPVRTRLGMPCFEALVAAGRIGAPAAGLRRV